MKERILEILEAIGTTHVREIENPKYGEFTIAAYTERVLAIIDADIKKDPLKECPGLLFGSYRQTLLGEIAYVCEYRPLPVEEATFNSSKVFRTEQEKIILQMQGCHPELQLVGDTHSHPNRRLFPSFEDLHPLIPANYIHMITNPRPPQHSSSLDFIDFRIVNKRYKDPTGYCIVK